MPRVNSRWALLGLNQVSANLSAAEITNLVNNPINLIAHPGPGKATLIMHIVATSVFNSIPFTNPAGSAAAQICFDGPSKIPATVDLVDLEPLIVGPQTATGNVVMLGGGSIGVPTDVQPIREIMDRSVVIGNFFLTTPQNFQNGDGSVQIELLYVTISLN